MQDAFVLLALDPAKHVSGAALFVVEGSGTKTTPLAYERVTKQSQRHLLVEMATKYAERWACPLVVVAEEWDPPRHKRSGFDQKWTYKTVLGVGEGWGRWTAELENFDVRHVVRVTPNTWRDAVFGKTRPKNSEDLKALAAMYVAGRLKVSVPDDNVCEAICIGFWGAIAQPVTELASKERVRMKKRRVCGVSEQIEH